ncbi:MAG: DUF4403 family protein [Nitrospiraceae bacterium]|nr:DUF4403 family protein [Nitrospiraceae bacterium]
MGSRRFHACLLPLLSACVVLGLGMASETASAGQSAQPTPPPSGMAVHIPFSADAIGQYYEQVHDELSERRANGNEWITLGGGTGFLKYRLWPGDHEHSLSAASVRTQSVLPFGVEYAKKVKGTITKLATCGLESPATGAGRLSVSMETRFGYGRSYQLLPSTNIASVEPKGSCLMQERTVDATPLMLQVYRSELQQALPMADQKAKQALSLKAAMVEVWRDLHEPLLLDEAASLWLLVHPEAVGSGAVQPTPTTLTAGFGITAHPAVVRGAKPAVPLRPLPELGDGGAPDGFRVTFDAAIPMEEANQRLREAVVGQEWSLGVGMVRIADAKLYPAGEQAAVELVLRGLLPYTVVLKGTPEYDEAAGQILFKRFDYQIKERTGVTDFAEAYLHDTLRDLLAQHVTVPVRDELDAMRGQVEKGLNRPLKGGRLRGRVEELTLKSLAFHPEGLSASFKIAGELHYDVTASQATP